MSEQRVKWGGPGEDYRLARIGRVGGNQWADAPAGNGCAQSAGSRSRVVSAHAQALDCVV